MNIDAQNKSEEELLEELKIKMPISEILGKYSESKILSKLTLLNKREDFKTESLSLNLEYSKPYVPAPIDIIPFGYTGGDGCYLAFLTDFGFYSSLDECPIVFISPTDFDANHPQHANKIIAKNIIDFLSILIKIRNPEVTRFEDIKTMDFDFSLDEYIRDFKNDSLDYILELQNSTIELIKSNFELNDIVDLNQYFINLEIERNGDFHIKTKDNLNIRVKEKYPEKINRIDSMLSPELLDQKITNIDTYSKFVFYRESPYIYPHFKQEFSEILNVIIKSMVKISLIRESNILKFELKQNKISEAWLEKRREKLKTRDNNALDGQTC
jgi:hypothetical protein